MPTLTRTGSARCLWVDSALADVLIEGEEERRPFGQREDAFTDTKRRHHPVLDHVSEDDLLANPLRADGEVGRELFAVGAEALSDDVAARIVHEPEREKRPEARDDAPADLGTVGVKDLVDVLRSGDELEAEAAAEV